MIIEENKNKLERIERVAIIKYGDKVFDYMLKWIKHLGQTIVARYKSRICDLLSM